MKNTEKPLPTADEIIAKEYDLKLQKEDNPLVKDKKVEKIYYSANFEGLCDLVMEDEEVKFLMLDGKIIDKAVVNDKVYQPPKREKLAYDLPNSLVVQAHVTGVSGVTGVPKNVGVSDRDKELFEKIVTFHEESAELPDDRLYILIAAWDIHTHLLEKFTHSPIIFFEGLPEKGKSRMASSMLFVSRRGVRKASVSDAQIIREASDQGATIFFDMTNFWASIQKSGSEDVVLSRFERGLRVARVLNPDKGAFEDMTYFNVFGPTIIASNDTIEQVLGSRTIPIVMKQAKKNFKNAVDEEKGKKLREELVAFRLRHFDTKLPEVDKIVTGRFGDIVRPLHQIIKFIKPELEDKFISLVKDMYKSRQDAKAHSLEGEIIQSILALSGEVDGGILPVKLITNKLNEEKSEKEKLTYQRVGRKLDIMGYQKAKTSNGSSAIVWSDEFNASLAIEHGLIDNIGTPTSSGTSETPETSVTPDSNVDNIIGTTKKIFDI